jgi:hypothetical protein
MANTSGVTIVDESTAGGRRSWNLDVADILEETLPLREIIRRRVYQEVTEYNGQQSDVFYGLVQPTDAERALNGYRLRTPRHLDWEAQYTKAVEAFEHRGYIVLVNDQQVTDLDAVVKLRVGAEVTFLKLVPLVGG